jgi:hypothetical protein
MCAQHAPEVKIDAARELAASGKIDRLSSGTPQALKRSYVFHSPADATVREQSGKANIAFLTEFIGADPIVDWGNAVDGSDKAGHGILAPDRGNESCQTDGREVTYVRKCGAEDNAGKMFHALYEPNSPFDPSKRVNDIPENDVWQFDQRQFIEDLKAAGVTVAPDKAWFWWPYRSSRRRDFDMAQKGYIYVPPSCRLVESACRVHVAVHGCKQNAKEFATKAGYNNWAEHYKAIVVYPALAPSTPISEAVCQGGPIGKSIDDLPIKPNLNGCWDWWGYLDTSDQKNRYLTKQSPQILVLQRIIDEITHR